MSENALNNFTESIETISNTPLNVIVSESVSILGKLHFIRAEWFYAFIPLLFFLYLYSNKTQSNKSWHAVVDQQLTPFVLTNRDTGNKRYPLLLTFVAASLCITALAGPVYKKLPQPVYREQSSLVVLLDLSKSMDASDIKPTRLSRAKLKLLDILKTRKSGQTALIVYAADAFVVTPLTDDNATIANLVPALETSLIPAQGSNLSIALAKTFSLFTQAGVIRGDILVMTDDIHRRDEKAIKKVTSQGHRLSIFAIGTTEGGPVPLQNTSTGGFLKDSNGALVIPKLQAAKLQQYALTGGGIYADLKADDSDIERFSHLFQSEDITKDEAQNPSTDIWQEEGHWLLLPLLFFAALWARKGWLAVTLPFVLACVFSSLVVLPQKAYAETTTSAPDNREQQANKQRYLDSQHLWSSPDQKAMKAFNSGDHEKAAEYFNQPDWKASALYRAGDYDAAAKLLDNADSSDGYYNKANALAKLGKYEEAIKAYDRALELDQKNEDAKYNREQVKQALEKQQQNSQPDRSQPDDSEQNKADQNNASPDKSDQDKSAQNNQQQQGQQDNQPSSDEVNNAEQEQQAATDSEQRQTEEQALRQRDAEAEKDQQQQELEQYEKDQAKQEKDGQNKNEQNDKEQHSDSVKNKETESDKAEQDPLQIDVNPTQASITEEEKATAQWLKRIPDDPAGLLRRKFLYQYKKAPQQTDAPEPW